MPAIRVPQDWNGMNFSYWLKHEYYEDSFFGLVMTGRQRKGKTSYVCQAYAEALGSPDNPNYDGIKRRMVFPPREFLNIVLHTDNKELGVIWDDGGFWLFVLDWYAPFVKSVAKYIQLGGTQFANITITSPTQKLISSQVLDAMPEMYIGRVLIYGNDDMARRQKPRLAKAYERWDYPDGKKGGVQTRWKDKYNAFLPDPFYFWYEPQRKKYLDVAKELLQKEVNVMDKRTTQAEKAAFLEDVHKTVGDPERLQEVNEVLKQLEAVA